MRAAAATAARGALVNRAEVSGADPDPDPSNDCDSAGVEVAGGDEPAPRLVVTKRASRAAVRVGQPLSYVVRVWNEGSGVAGVVVVDPCGVPG